MLTVAQEFETSSNDTLYLTQHLNETPTSASGSSPIAPQSKTVVWEIIETVGGFEVRAVRMGRLQQSAASGYTKPSNKPIPENHIQEMKRTLIFDLPIRNTDELTFYNLKNEPIQKNKEPAVQ